MLKLLTVITGASVFWLLIGSGTVRAQMPTIASDSPAQNELDVVVSADTFMAASTAGRRAERERQDHYLSPGQADRRELSPDLSGDAGSSEGISYVGRWPFGPARAVAVQNDRVYLGSGGGIYVLDVGDPTSPAEISRITTSGMVYSLFVDNSILYVADDGAGLVMIDEAYLEEVGSYNTPGNACDVYVLNNLAYVAAGGAGIRIIDVYDPSGPFELGYYDVGGYSDARCVFVLDSLAYVGHGTTPDGFRIVNVNDPTSPIELGYFGLFANDVCVLGGLAYLAGNVNGLRVVDVVDPTNPFEAGYYYPGYARGVCVRDTLAYMAYSADSPDLGVFSVADPATPYPAGFCETPGFGERVYVQDTLAFVAARSGGLRVINVSDPANPGEIGAYTTPDRGENVYVEGIYAYLADGSGGLRIINVEDPTEPYEEGYCSTPYDADGVYVEDLLAYVADGSGGLRIVDVSDPNNPYEVGFYDSVEAIDVSVLNSVVYVASRYGGLRIIDAADPSDPYEVGFFDMPEPAWRVYVLDTLVYVVGGNDIEYALRIINAADPENPYEVGYIKDYRAGIFEPTDVFVLDTLAYVTYDDYDGYVCIISVADPANPYKVGGCEVFGYARSVYVQGSLAGVADWAGLRLINVADPSSPYEVGFYETPGWAEGVYVQDSLAYIADEEGGMIILTFESPTLTPPHVLSTSPDQNELNVSANTNISVTFDTYMDPATISNSTFVVHARNTGLHGGTITYDNPTRTATLNPSADFDGGEIVNVALTTGIESSGGIPMDTSYVWSFTVETGNGSGVFNTSSVFPVGENPWSVCAADFDNDGDIDLASANWNTHGVTVLRNSGSGSFSLRSDYDVFYNPVSICAADLDGDGDVDIAVGSESGAGDSISVLLNNGDATFGTHSCYAVTGFSQSICASDFDGDGDIDLATTCTESDAVTVLLNNGDGSFASHTPYAVGDRPHSVAAGDLDGDADLDLVVANMYSDDVSVLMNNGNGTYASQVQYAVDPYPVSVFVADINGNGVLDLATATSEGVSILMNDGDGTFSPHVDYVVGGDMPASLSVADLNGDASLDLATVNWDSHNASVLFNNGDGTYAPYAIYPVVGYNPRSVSAADLDGDGDVDLAVATETSDSVTVLYNANLICGDFDQDGVVGIGDHSALLLYLWSGGSAPSYYGQVDMDDYEVVTLSDYLRLFDLLFGPGTPLDCDLVHEKLSGPVDSSNYLELVESVFPPDETSMTLHFNLSTAVSVHMGSLPVRIRVGGQVPTVTDCQLTSLLDGFFPVKLCQVDEDSGKVLFSFGKSVSTGGIGPLDGEMAIVNISMPASSAFRPITIAWDPFPPVHHDPPKYDNEYSHYPVLVEADKTAWTPHLTTRPCCVGLTGNVDGDPGDIVDIGDLTALIDFLFISFEEPACMEEANVDGTEPVDIGDLTALIDYLFISFTPPADCL